MLTITGTLKWNTPKTRAGRGTDGTGGGASKGATGYAKSRDIAPSLQRICHPYWEKSAYFPHSALALVGVKLVWPSELAIGTFNQRLQRKHMLGPCWSLLAMLVGKGVVLACSSAKRGVGVVVDGKRVVFVLCRMQSH